MNLIHSSKHDDTTIAQCTRTDIIHLLFDQSALVLVGHLSIITLYAYWIYPAAQHSQLQGWVVAGLLISFVRFALFLIYQKYHNKLFSQSIWVLLWTLMTVLMSLLYAYVCIFVTPISQPQYMVGMAALLFVILGSTALSYAASMYAIACFIVPVSTITSVYLFTLASREASLVGIAIVLFAAINLLFVRNINKALIKSIELNYQNKQEIDKRKLVERQLYEISRRDSLTGLFNRRYFDEMLEVELGRAYRNHSALSLVLIDVDYFKEYNDHYGHVAGDNCLIAISHIIEGQINRKGDLVARYGGEEFAVILPGIDARGALAFANRLQTVMQNRRLEHKTSKLTSLASITISVGVTSVVPVMKIKPNQMIDQADKALYDAKKEGRNRVKVFSPFGIDHQGLI